MPSFAANLSAATCFELVSKWTVKTGWTAQQLCLTPLTQFEQVANPSAPLSSSGGVLADLCSATCGFEGVGNCSGVLAPKCSEIRDLGLTLECANVSNGVELPKNETLMQATTLDSGAKLQRGIMFAGVEGAGNCYEQSLAEYSRSAYRSDSTVEVDTSASSQTIADSQRSAYAVCPTATVLVLPPNVVLGLGGVQIEIPSGAAVEIRGTGGGATLNGQQLSRIFNLHAGAQLILRDVHLVNGSADAGGCVKIDGVGVGTGFTMFGGSISDCHATGDGGGIYALGSAIKRTADDGNGIFLQRTEIARCTAGGEGSGVFTRTHFLWLYDVRIIDCSAVGVGGGISLHNLWSGYARNLTIARCVSGLGAGGLAIANARYNIDVLEIFECRVDLCQGCEASFGGASSGFSVYLGAIATIDDAHIHHNANGGFSVLSGASLQSSRLLLEENIGTIGAGGFLSEASKLKLINSKIRKNVADTGGAAFWVHINSELHLIDSEVSENQGGLGAGITVSTGSRLIMERSSIKKNFRFGENPNVPYFLEYTEAGGGVLLLAGHLTMLDGSEISYNEALYGGGVQVGAGSTLIGKNSFIGHNGGPTCYAGAQIFLGGGGWFHVRFGSADSIASGLPDPKVELFDMTIEHTCQWELLRPMYFGTPRITSSAFGYSLDWMQDPMRSFIGWGLVPGIDRPVDFDGKALDIRNSRISVSDCADKMALRQLQSFDNGEAPPAQRRLQSTPTELGVGLPPNALPAALIKPC